MRVSFVSRTLDLQIFAKRRILICAYFSLKEPHFRCRKQLRFTNSATVTCEVHGNSISGLRIFTLDERFFFSMALQAICWALASYSVP
jgi:hypothetical protein